MAARAAVIDRCYALALSLLAAQPTATTPTALVIREWMIRVRFEMSVGERFERQLTLEAFLNAVERAKGRPARDGVTALVTALRSASPDSALWRP